MSLLLIRQSAVPFFQAPAASSRKPRALEISMYFARLARPFVEGSRNGPWRIAELPSKSAQQNQRDSPKEQTLAGLHAPNGRAAHYEPATRAMGTSR
jgi:hypothetical protein